MNAMARHFEGRDREEAYGHMKEHNEMLDRLEAEARDGRDSRLLPLAAVAVDLGR